MGSKKIDISGVKKALVTGGGGFVGMAIVKMLVENGVSCRVIGRNHYPEVVALGAECIVANIADLDAMIIATRDVDTVFHVAALAGIWGGWKSFYETNVCGTEAVIKSCRLNGVKRLIYTSTPSVVFSGGDIVDGDESLAYGTKFLCSYARSKVMAEKLVLAANGTELLTCAIRPHLIWGPGDPHLIPRLIERGRKKMLKIVGTGGNMVDISYIDNVAYAHLLAAANLVSRKTAAGKPYFIGQAEPVKLWGWINELFSGLDIPEVNSSVPYPVAYMAGGVLELVCRILCIKKEPKMTRFLAQQLSKSHYFSHQSAKRDLGYEPIVSTEEGMERLMRWVKSYEKKGL